MDDNFALRSKEVTLFEVLDRILDKGIVIKGDLIISIADVNLIYVGLQVIITSVDRLLRVEPEKKDVSGLLL
ncbi:MAG: gas vesicle protein [Eubacteriales bacterium]